METEGGRTSDPELGKSLEIGKHDLMNLALLCRNFGRK